MEVRLSCCVRTGRDVHMFLGHDAAAKIVYVNVARYWTSEDAFISARVNDRFRYCFCIVVSGVNNREVEHDIRTTGRDTNVTRRSNEVVVPNRCYFIQFILQSPNTTNFNKLTDYWKYYLSCEKWQTYEEALLLQQLHMNYWIVNGKEILQTYFASHYMSLLQYLKNDYTSKWKRSKLNLHLITCNVIKISVISYISNYEWNVKKPLTL